MFSLRKPFKGSGSGGGFGSAFPRMRCSISLGLRSPFLWRILKVSIDETMSLCFSKRPLLVKWKATIEIESIRAVILSLRSSTERASASSLPSSAAGAPSSALGYPSLGYPSLGSSGLASPSAGSPSTLVFFLFFLRALTSGIMAFPSASISYIFSFVSIPSVMSSIARLITSMKLSKEYL